MAITAFPLAWPEGWPRTPPHWRRKNSPFKVLGDQVQRELLAELRRLGARNIVVSTNIPLRVDGTPYRDAARRRIDDPGVAVYFALNGRQLSMARDKYWRVEDNLRSIGLAIEAIRAIERHGGATMMEKAFAGFSALPPPRSCWDVLGLAPRSSADDVRRAWRDKARAAHPDAGGSDAAMAELNAARDAALREIGHG